MRCASCYGDNDDLALGCARCGQPLTRPCPACGALCPGGWRFCGRCGVEIALPSGDAAAAEGTVSAPGPFAAGLPRERRPLTILFCDLAGSTALSARLDAEDFGELIGAYFAVCKSVFERHEGYVDKEEGDCLRVYFGLPLARDDDALRAVRAALEAVEAVAELGHRLGQPLAAHVGVHSGEVIAGEDRGRARGAPLVVGEAPNVAKRLEETARAGWVLISGATHRLVERHIAAEPLGTLALKGLPRTEQAWRVLGQRGRGVTVEQFDARALAPLAGRGRALAELYERWHAACAGHGQVVRLAGEPGIGKSRLVHAFVSGLSDDAPTVRALQCQQPYATTALYPVIDPLRRAIGLGAEQDADARRRALEDAFAAGRLPQPEELALVAGLVSVGGVAVPAGGESTAPMLRERTRRWLCAWLLGAGRPGPQLLVVEDLHWADASTLDMLALLLEQVAERPVMVLLTHRSEFVPTWSAQVPCTLLTLERLTAAETAAMVRAITGTAGMPDDLAARIAERSDGVPLFVEELTRMALDHAGFAAGLRLAPAAAEQGGAATIPDTLRGLLTARLDHLRSAKPVAQLASVLGREFSVALLKRVSGLDDAALHAALDELVAAELLYERAADAHEYAFKHVLVQDAAYRSLLKPRRREYHRRAAEVLVESFPELVESHPELAAHHWGAAGLADRASGLWHQAGEKALAAAADVEAAEHLRRALQQVALLPAGAERIALELNCLSKLGWALSAVQGYGAPEVEQTFAEAHERCRQLGDAEQLYTVLMGLHSFYQVRGPLRRAVELGERLLTLAEGERDPVKLAQSHRCLGWSLFCNGRTKAGRQHLQRALALYDPSHAAVHSRLHGAHPLIVGSVNLAWLEQLDGHPERAAQLSAQAIARARELRGALALAYALCMSAAVRCSADDPAGALVLAEEVIELAERQGMSYWSAWGRVIAGWAMVERGRAAEGLPTIVDGCQRYQATGARLFEPYSLALLARCQAATGATQAAAAARAAALASPLVAEGYFYAGQLQRDLPGTR